MDGWQWMITGLGRGRIKAGWHCWIMAFSTVSIGRSEAKLEKFDGFWVANIVYFDHRVRVLSAYAKVKLMLNVKTILRIFLLIGEWTFNLVAAIVLRIW
jgi:hypothetical protein